MEKELPIGWARCAISDVFKINPGHQNIHIEDEMVVTFLPMTLIFAEQNRIDTSDLRAYKEVKSGFTKFIEGDVLFAKITPCMENGKIAIATNLKNRVGCGTTELHVFRSIPETNNKYLYYYFLQRDFRGYCKSQFNGAVGQQRVPRSVFEELIFPLPPLPEQQRIVAKLDTLFGHLEALKTRLDRIPQLLKDFRQKVLIQAVTGKLTEEWREGRELGEWQDIIFKDFTDIDVGPAFKSAEFEDSGIRLLRGENIEPGALRWNNTVYFPEEKLLKFSHLFIKEGDVILAMDRPIISTGLKLAKAKKKDLPCVLVQRVARFRPSEKLSSGFLYFLISSDSYIKHLFGEQTGTQIPHISSKQILSFNCILPPLEEQQEIVRRVESLFAKADQIEAGYQKIKAKVDQLPQALLAKAFRGELVPQLSTDGDARELLEEIKLAKEGLEKGGKGKKMKVEDELRMVAEDGVRYGKK